MEYFSRASDKSLQDKSTLQKAPWKSPEYGIFIPHLWEI
jgi:hypothetical protein